MRLLTLSTALLSTAFLLGCQEQASSPVEPEGPGPQFSAKKCLGDMTLPGCGGGSGGGSGELFEVVLGGNYFSSGPQNIDFQENGRRVVVKTEHGASIEYSIDITLDFDADNGSCAWSGFGDNAGAAAGTFWNTFPFADALPKNLLFRVNKKALREPAGEHRTEARWFVETEDIDGDENPDRVMYLVKTGVPGDLADQLSGFEPAIGDFDGTTVTITGGAVRLSQHNCGDPTGETAGCGPQAPTLEVACVNPTDVTGEFIATVTTKA